MGVPPVMETPIDADILRSSPRLKAASIGDLLKRLCSNAGDTFCVMYLVKSDERSERHHSMHLCMIPRVDFMQQVCITLYSSYGT